MEPHQGLTNKEGEASQALQGIAILLLQRDCHPPSSPVEGKEWLSTFPWGQPVLSHRLPREQENQWKGKFLSWHTCSRNQAQGEESHEGECFVWKKATCFQNPRRENLHLPQTQDSFMHLCTFSLHVRCMWQLSAHFLPDGRRDWAGLESSRTKQGYCSFKSRSFESWCWGDGTASRGPGPPAEIGKDNWSPAAPEAGIFSQQEAAKPSGGGWDIRHLRAVLVFIPLSPEAMPQVSYAWVPKVHIPWFYKITLFPLATISLSIMMSSSFMHVVINRKILFIYLF